MIWHVKQPAVEQFRPGRPYKTKDAARATYHGSGSTKEAAVEDAHTFARRHGAMPEGEPEIEER